MTQTTASKLKQNVEDLYSLIYSGQLLNAFEKYYAENVVMQENNEEPRRGKQLNRDYEQQFLANIEAFNGGGVLSTAYNEAEQVATIESWMDVTFKDGNRINLAQVSVQRWDGDQIVSERFYHA